MRRPMHLRRETSEGLSVGTSVGISYDGPTSLEERIFASPVIARVRLDSTTSTVEAGTTYRGLKYLATLEFSFSVQEYLKGSGADGIVAVWDAPFCDTRQEAEAALPAIAAGPGLPVGRPGGRHLPAALRVVPPEHSADGTILPFRGTLGGGHPR